MGMHYNVTFHDAILKPEKYGELIGWTEEEVAAEPDRVSTMAREQVEEILQEGCDTLVQDEDGLHLDGCSFQDSASYGYGDELTNLLTLCEPGAWILEIDEEDSSGSQWRRVVQADRSVKTVDGVTYFPGIDIPEDLPGLLNALRAPLHSYLTQLGSAERFVEPVRALLAEYDRCTVA